MNYTDVNTGQTVSTASVPFRLMRASELTSDSLRVNHQVDVQRNRIQTTQALKEAMDERSYNKSLEILRNQVLKIKASVTAQDPFCQQLIKGLEFRHASEQAYRSTHLSSYTQQRMERGAYTPAPWSATSFFLTPNQLHWLDDYERQHTWPIFPVHSIRKLHSVFATSSFSSLPEFGMNKSQSLTNVCLIIRIV